MLRAFGKGQRRVEDEAESARLMRLDHLQNVAVRAELELGPELELGSELELELGPRPPAERRGAPRHALTMTPILTRTLTQTPALTPTLTLTLTLTPTPTLTLTLTLTPSPTLTRCAGSPSSGSRAPSVRGSRPTRCSTDSSRRSAARRAGSLGPRRRRRWRRGVSIGRWSCAHARWA